MQHARSSSLLSRPCPLRRASCRVRRRRCVRVSALWTPWGDGETDDEILTAAAVSDHGGRQSQWQRQVKQAVAPLGAGAPEEPSPRQTLPAFAAALVMITAGAFFFGSAIRRYILQPANLPDGSNTGGGTKAKRRASVSTGGSSSNGGSGARSAPSVRDLLAQHGPPAVTTGQGAAAAQSAPPAAAQACAEAEGNDAAGGKVGQAGPAAAASTAPAAPAPAAQGDAAPASKAAQPAAANAPPAEDVPAGSLSPAKSAGEGAAAGKAADLKAGAPTAAAAAGVPPNSSGTAEGQQPAALTGEAWCSTILEPALREAQAAKQGAQQKEAEEAAAANPMPATAAAPLLACSQLCALTQQAAQGPVMLRLLFPVPSAAGEEQHCVALFQEDRDAEALQRTLRVVLGLPTSLQQLPADGMVTTAAQQGWGVAFFPAGSLRGALAAVEDAAVQQQQLAADMAEDEEQGRVGEGGEGEGPDVTELLYAALQRQALVLGGQEVQEASQSLLASQAASAAAAGQRLEAPLQPHLQQKEQQRRPKEDEKLPAPSAVPQQAAAAARAQGDVAAQQKPEQEGKGEPPAGPEAAAAQAAAAEQLAQSRPSAPVPAQQAHAQQAVQQAQQAAQQGGGGPSGDPWWEEQTRRRAPAKLDPNWWRSLPVLHVPQLLYGDGAKGLMTVPVCIPDLVAAVPGAAAAAAGDSNSGGIGGSEAAATAANGDSGGGGVSSSNGMICERRLVAFADLKDAEGLAECSIMKSEQGVVDIQMLSVPPAQLAQHAAANSCGVAVLPRRELALPAGADYDELVALVVNAVERRFYEEVLHRAYAKMCEAKAQQAADKAASSSSAGGAQAS